MASISGQSTANIDQVDGFFTTQGGGASPEPIINSSGVQISANGTLPYNTSVSLEFNRSSVAPYNFVSVAGSPAYNQIFGVRDDGTLWAYVLATSWIGQMGLTQGQWTQYGTDTDWEQVDSANNGWGFIKGGEYWYVGYGAFGLRGDGSTTTIGSPQMMNNTFTWTKMSMGQQTLALVNSAGEVYTTGSNSNYGNGLGVSSGTTSTLTRESASLTGVTDISCAYQTLKIVTGGNVYTTGSNNYLSSGPLAVGSTINGPILSYNGGDIVKVFTGRDHTVAITNTGEVRHAGTGAGKRLDNISTNLTGYSGQANEQFTLLTGAGSGWTDYAVSNTASANWITQLAIKNGEVYGSFDNKTNVWGNTASNVYQQVGTLNTATKVMVDFNGFSVVNFSIVSS